MQLIVKKTKKEKLLSNKNNLPNIIVSAVSNDPYDNSGSDISVTSLIKPPRIRRLTEYYEDYIIEDVSDLIFALLGQSVHHVIERAASKSDIVETRLFYKGEETNDWKLSGQLDLLTGNGNLIDFKVTSAWTAMDAIQNNKPEWEQQLNVLDFLCRNNSDTIHPVKSLSIMAILRDWSKLRVMKSDNYPKQQVVMIPIRQWSAKEQSDFIKTKIKAHQRAQKANINCRDEIPVCTPQERWAKPDTYAVMKHGRKTALRVLDTLEKAKAFMKIQNLEEKKDATIVLRKGEDVRCVHYCNVNKYCFYFKEKSVEF
jgi:hypothetical protein